MSARMSPSVQPFDPSQLPTLVQPPGENSHKYTRGVLGVLTGSEEYPGAALMNVRAAVNTGAGMVRFAGSGQLNFLMNLSVPEAVCSTGDPLELRVDAWALGSGVSQGPRLEQVGAVLSTGAAAVVDAGAVALAAQLVAEGRRLEPQHILTPHAGELADFFTWVSALAPNMLTGAAPQRSEIEDDPALWASRAAYLSGATVLLKGGETHVATSDGEQVFTVAGNSPWLATAGSGDTLTGVLGALLAQHQAHHTQPSSPAVYAQLAAAAVTVHGAAADLVHAPATRGPLPPTEVAHRLPAALAQLLSEPAS